VKIYSGIARGTGQAHVPWFSIYTPRRSFSFPPGRGKGITGQWGVSGRLPRRVFYLLGIPEKRITA
jgi:hypothetical protein